MIWDNYYSKFNRKKIVTEWVSAHYFLFDMHEQLENQLNKNEKNFNKKFYLIFENLEYYN